MTRRLCYAMQAGESFYIVGIEHGEPDLYWRIREVDNLRWAHLLPCALFTIICSKTNGGALMCINQGHASVSVAGGASTDTLGLTVRMFHVPTHPTFFV